MAGAVYLSAKVEISARVRGKLTVTAVREGIMVVPARVAHMFQTTLF